MSRKTEIEKAQQELATFEAAQAGASFDPETGEVFEAETVPTLNVETGETYDDGLQAPPVVMTETTHYNLMAQLDALENARSIVRVNSTYYQFTQPGQKVRGIFQGMSAVTKNTPDGQKSIPVVQLMTREGMTLHGSVGVIQHFVSLPVGAAVEIEYAGTEKTARGHNVKTFNVSLLSI